MPGRHDAPDSPRRRWAPTAIDAVLAITPTASLAAAFGLAGGGYLTGREDVAACGALAGAFGLVVERFATRSVRVRLRRERARYRGDLQDVGRLLHEMQRDLAGLRTDLDEVRSERDEVRSERDAVRDQLHDTLGELAHVRAVAPAAPVLVGPTYAVVEEPVLAEPVLVRVAEGPSGEVPADGAGADETLANETPAEETPAEEAVAVAAVPRLLLSLLVPGQVRSPIATGGIPVLAPGPSEPVRVVDLRTATRSAGSDDETQPIPVLTAQLADALVYAAMAEAEAAEITRSLELPDAGGRPAGALHTGDAHHAGDYARDLVPVGASIGSVGVGSASVGSVGVGGGSGTATLYIVRRGKHVA